MRRRGWLAVALLGPLATAAAAEGPAAGVCDAAVTAPPALIDAPDFVLRQAVGADFVREPERVSALFAARSKLRQARWCR